LEDFFPIWRGFKNRGEESYLKKEEVGPKGEGLPGFPHYLGGTQVSPLVRFRKAKKDLVQFFIRARN